MIEFNSPSLRDAYNGHKDALTYSAASKNEMSKDIIGLEKYLKTLTLTDDFVYKIDASRSLGWNVKAERLMANQAEGGQIIVRPLIEMKFEFRKSVYPYLGDFLNDLAEKTIP